MKRIAVRTLMSLIPMLIAVAAVPTLQAQQVRDPFFRVYDVAGNVSMLEAPGAGGNIGVLSGEDGFLLIDDRFDQDTDALLFALEELGGGAVRYVVNTHIHPDHIGGNNRLAALGASIISHDSVRVKMLTELRIPRRGGIFYPEPPVAARPVLTFGEAVTLHLNGEEVRIWLAPPAHTDGDSFVYFVRADVLHLGDVFRTNMYPIIDVYNGGSFLGMIEAMGQAVGIAGPGTRVIPGHGEGYTDRQGLIEVHDMLLDMRDRVQAHIDRGDTVEQTLQAQPLASLDARWGGVPSWTATDLVPIIYGELAEN